jgi:hypothetical protein
MKRGGEDFFPASFVFIRIPSLQRFEELLTPFRNRGASTDRQIFAAVSENVPKGRRNEEYESVSVIIQIALGD